MAEGLTKSAARNIFYGGSLFFGREIRLLNGDNAVTINTERKALIQLKDEPPSGHENDENQESMLWR